MFQIQNLTDDPKQKQSLVLPDGTTIEITINFVPLQQGWFFTEIVYRDFVLNGLRITNIPDMLYQFRNKIPFGIACISVDNREPSLQGDFLSQASRLFVLTQAEVNQYKDFLSGQV